ncbi:Hypothetical predicted protein [Olea europaea subsp. europaea]|uniref:Uncharacterized protein n=1 Tax=Olea europaea subsp. europaea TaxID=158383 RepID=A0A8S0TP98_OLEEU|nr:Hypothetical predicted protein [Olea europaea subsp. europaea]
MKFMTDISKQKSVVESTGNSRPDLAYKSDYSQPDYGHKIPEEPLLAAVIGSSHATAVIVALQMNMQKERNGSSAGWLRKQEALYCSTTLRLSLPLHLQHSALPQCSQHSHSTLRLSLPLRHSHRRTGHNQKQHASTAAELCDCTAALRLSLSHSSGTPARGQQSSTPSLSRSKLQSITDITPVTLPLLQAADLLNLEVEGVSILFAFQIG